jgi:hypothetical protein
MAQAKHREDRQKDHPEGEGRILPRLDELFPAQILYLG